MPEILEQAELWLVEGAFRLQPRYAVLLLVLLDVPLIPIEPDRHVRLGVMILILTAWCSVNHYKECSDDRLAVRFCCESATPCSQGADRAWRAWAARP